MTLFQQLGDGGVNGANVDIPSSGGPISDPFSAISSASGAWTWDNSKGVPPGSVLAMKSVPAGSGTSYGTYNTSTNQWSMSEFIWLDTLPDVEIGMLGAYAGTVRACVANILPTGKPTTRNAANATASTTFTNSVPLGEWVRFDFSGIVGTTTTNGTITLAMFHGNSATPIESITIAGTANTGTVPVTVCRSPFRIGTSSQTVTMYAGSVRFRDDTSALLGPIDSRLTAVINESIGNVDMPTNQQVDLALGLFESIGFLDDQSLVTDTATVIGDLVGLLDSATALRFQGVTISDVIGLLDSTVLVGPPYTPIDTSKNSVMDNWRQTLLSQLGLSEPQYATNADLEMQWLVSQGFSGSLADMRRAAGKPINFPAVDDVY